MNNFCESSHMKVETIKVFEFVTEKFNPLHAELNSICHLLALLGAHHILHVSRIRTNLFAKEAAFQ